MSDNLKKMAEAFAQMTWREMMRFSVYVTEEIPHLQKSGDFDAIAVANLLADAADDILKEAKEIGRE